MPNRILKESICTSETVDGLGSRAEVFFYRLITACDDFGRMDARPSILRARCFPLRLDTISDADILRWLEELRAVSLIELYEVDSRTYLHMVSWARHQQIRSMRSKFPAPEAGTLLSDSDCNQLISTASKCPRNPIRIQSESESESESYSSAQQSPTEQSAKPPRKSPEYAPDSEPYQLADRLAGHILGNDPAARVPTNLQPWARDMAALLKDRDPTEVRDTLDWCQADPFWRCNILSANKFREKFTALKLKRAAEREPPRKASRPIANGYEMSPEEHDNVRRFAARAVKAGDYPVPSVGK